MRNDEARPATADGTGEAAEATEKRKSEHIDICLRERVSGENITTGLEKYRFRHNALPDIDFADIDLGTVFLGKPLKAPLLISSMTGGTKAAADINRNLAMTAERRGWALGVGSMRAAVENAALRYSYDIRRYAPSIPVIANLGAVQLNYGYGPDQCRRAVEMLQADGLVLHLNSMQEVFQPEGNTNFKDLLRKIEAVCASLSVPVGVKEVGWGISGEVAERLYRAGVAFIDVAGAGGTSWSQVEKHRVKDAVKREAAEAFAGWGIPTADCIRDVRERVPDAVIVASGGLQTGVDAAKALALGADLAGFGRSLLGAAVESDERLEQQLARAEWELRVAMFGIGVRTIGELKRSKSLERIE